VLTAKAEYQQTGDTATSVYANEKLHEPLSSVYILKIIKTDQYMVTAHRYNGHLGNPAQVDCQDGGKSTKWAAPR
jgi:hypothetical protein